MTRLRALALSALGVWRGVFQYGDLHVGPGHLFGG